MSSPDFREAFPFVQHFHRKNIKKKTYPIWIASVPAWTNPFRVFKKLSSSIDFILVQIFHFQTPFSSPPPNPSNQKSHKFILESVCVLQFLLKKLSSFSFHNFSHHPFSPGRYGSGTMMMSENRGKSNCATQSCLQFLTLPAGSIAMRGKCKVFPYFHQMISANVAFAMRQFFFCVMLLMVVNIAKLLNLTFYWFPFVALAIVVILWEE